MTEQQISEVVESLRGTCMNSVQQAIEDVFGVDHKLTFEEESELEHRVEQELFVCDQCGWCCEMGEQDSDIEDEHGVLVCEDCRDEYIEK